MPSSNNSSESTTALETALKELLDKVLVYIEKFITSKEDLSTIEAKLKDYDSLLELVQITDSVFVSLTEKIDQKLGSINNEGNYDELEKILQKHEGEIRNHIRIEQQLKLYAESIQEKLDESEKTRSELLEQTKTMLNDVRRDNQKLSESLKLKTEENEKLNKTLKALEDANKGYEAKLQGIPQLHERINQLEKKRKISTSKPVFILKDTSHSVLDIENSKRVDPDTDISRPTSKPDTARKTLKATATAQYTSPLKFIHKTLSNVSTTINKTQEYVKVKLEPSENRPRKDLEALKQSYQKFYNPTKGMTKERLRERERERHATSVSRTRDMKSIYSIALITNSSNTSLIQNNQNNHNQSHRESLGSRIHQRSNSHDIRPKTKTNSFIKAN